MPVTREVLLYSTIVCVCTIRLIWKLCSCYVRPRSPLTPGSAERPRTIQRRSYTASPRQIIFSPTSTIDTPTSSQIDAFMDSLDSVAPAELVAPGGAYNLAEQVVAPGAAELVVPGAAAPDADTCGICLETPTSSLCFTCCGKGVCVECYTDYSSAQLDNVSFGDISCIYCRGEVFVVNRTVYSFDEISPEILPVVGMIIYDQTCLSTNCQSVCFTTMPSFMDYSNICGHCLGVYCHSCPGKIAAFGQLAGLCVDGCASLKTKLNMLSRRNSYFFSMLKDEVKNFNFYFEMNNIPPLVITVSWVFSMFIQERFGYIPSFTQRTAHSRHIRRLLLDPRTCLPFDSDPGIETFNSLSAFGVEPWVVFSERMYTRFLLADISHDIVCRFATETALQAGSVTLWSPTLFFKIFRQADYIRTIVDRVTVAISRYQNIPVTPVIQQPRVPVVQQPAIDRDIVPFETPVSSTVFARDIADFTLKLFIRRTHRVFSMPANLSAILNSSLLDVSFDERIQMFSEFYNGQWNSIPLVLI